MSDGSKLPVTQAPEKFDTSALHGYLAYQCRHTHEHTHGYTYNVKLLFLKKKKKEEKKLHFDSILKVYGLLPLSFLGGEEGCMMADSAWGSKL